MEAVAVPSSVATSTSSSATTTLSSTRASFHGTTHQPPTRRPGLVTVPEDRSLKNILEGLTRTKSSPVGRHPTSSPTPRLRRQTESASPHEEPVRATSSLRNQFSWFQRAAAAEEAEAGAGSEEVEKRSGTFVRRQAQLELDGDKKRFSKIRKAKTQRLARSCKARITIHHIQSTSNEDSGTELATQDYV